MLMIRIKKISLFDIIIFLFGVASVLFFIFPLYWQISTSIKIRENSLLIPPQLIPNPIDISLYKTILFESIFPVSVRNSLIVSSVTTLTCITCSTLASYAISRLKIFGHQYLLFAFLVISMLPPVAFIGPLFVNMRNLGLINSKLGIIIVYTAYFLPFTMWFLSSFFRTLPKELEEAGLIDGCSHFQVLYKIILPLSAPALFTVGTLVFIFSWNEFLFSFTFLSTDDVRTYPVGLLMFQGIWEIPWPEMSAASTIVVIPIIILVLIAQRYIIQGLTAGAVKG